MISIEFISCPNHQFISNRSRRCALNLDCLPNGNGNCLLKQQGQSCNTGLFDNTIYPVVILNRNSLLIKTTVIHFADNDCGGYFPTCVDKKCDSKRYAGDDCISNTQCWRFEHNDCNIYSKSGFCDDGTCGGIEELLPCQATSAACGQGLYCTPAGKCAKRIEIVSQRFVQKIILKGKQL